MDNFYVPISILMDLSKAFDTLDHDIMLSKLCYYGVSDVEFNFFATPRFCSGTPIKFLTYINDLPTVSKFFYILMYADNTTLFCNFVIICNETTINK